jgi:aspartate racemase
MTLRSQDQWSRLAEIGAINVAASNSEKTIGIVAGAGPFAGQDLVQKVLDQTLATRDQDHLNLIALYRPNEITDRTEYLLDSSLPNPGYAIARQVLDLHKLGAEIAAIPCNTAHAPEIYGVIKSELKAAHCPVRFLHMVQETVIHLRTYHAHVEQIGVLSTTGTYNSHIYPTHLEAAGFDVIVPDEQTQTQTIHPAIYDPEYGIKATGAVTPRARQDLLQSAYGLLAQSAQAVILACTEMPLAIREQEIEEAAIIDPTLILARALIREANPAKLKPYVPAES